MEALELKGPQFTRREILAAFLGLPVALTACNRLSKKPRIPDGEIVGASDGIGHRLRDGFRPQPAADQWKKGGTVIVGGGVAGLSAAWRLKRSGYEDFVILELESAAGGTARSGESKITSYPWGAHYIPVPTKDNCALTTLLTEMGVIEGRNSDGDPIVGEQYICRDPEERVFYRGRWYEGLYLHAGASPEDKRQFEEFQKEISRWVGWRDGKDRRAFTIPTAYGSDDAEVTALDRISMAQWMMDKGFTSSRLQWYVEYACKDDYGSFLADTSAWAGIFYFASRVPKQGVEAEPLITWPEGNGRLVKYLYADVGDRARLGFAAAEIIPSDSAGVDVIAVSHDGNECQGFHADRVVFAAPRFLAKYLIRPYRDSTPTYLNEFEYGSWMVANLTLRDRPQAVGFPLCWDNVLYGSPSLGYVVATHQKGIDYGPTIFTYYYPLCDTDSRKARQRLLSTDWNAWADVALTDLSRAHPEIRDLTERLDLMRWGHAMVRPKPGFIWGGAREKAKQPFRSIHFAHTDLSGVPLFEEAFYHGLRAAEEVLTARNIHFESML